MNQTKAMVLAAGQAAAQNLRNRRGQPIDQTIKYWFVYSIANFGGSTNTIANGATGTGSVQIQSDSDFLLQALSYTAKSANGTIVADAIMDATVQLTDLGSGSNLFDNPQFIRNVFGDAKLPFILPTPRILPANSSIGASIVNLTGGNLIGQITMHGRKVYGLQK